MSLDNEEYLVSLPSPISRPSCLQICLLISVFRFRTRFSSFLPFCLPHRFVDFVVQYLMFSLDSDASMMSVMRALFNSL